MYRRNFQKLNDKLRKQQQSQGQIIAFSWKYVAIDHTHAADKMCNIWWFIHSIDMENKRK